MHKRFHVVLIVHSETSIHQFDTFDEAQTLYFENAIKIASSPMVGNVGACYINDSLTGECVFAKVGYW